MKIPVDFEEKVKRPANASGGGYPVQLSARDLMQNFVYATEEFNSADFVEEEASGQGGFPKRKVSLKYRIPNLPGSGTYVLGSVNGVLEWISTEEC